MNKIRSVHYISIEDVLNAQELALFNDVETKLDLGNAAIHLFLATDVANVIESKIGGEVGRNMALKVCALPEHIYIRV